MLYPLSYEGWEPRPYRRVAFGSEALRPGR